MSYERTVEQILERTKEDSRMDATLRIMRNETARWCTYEAGMEAMRIDNALERLFLTARDRHMMLNNGEVDESLDNVKVEPFVWDYDARQHAKTRRIRDWLMHFTQLREYQLHLISGEPLKPWVQGIPLAEQPPPPVEAQETWERAQKRTR